MHAISDRARSPHRGADALFGFSLVLHQLVRRRAREPTQDADNLLKHVDLDLALHIRPTLGTLGVILADVPITAPLLPQAGRSHFPFGEARLTERVPATKRDDGVLGQRFVAKRARECGDECFDNGAISVVTRRA
jgi:hypothetical protein